MLVVDCTDTMAWGRVHQDAVCYVVAQYCWSLNTMKRKLPSSILDIFSTVFYDNFFNHCKFIVLFFKKNLAKWVIHMK